MIPSGCCDEDDAMLRMATHLAKCAFKEALRSRPDDEIVSKIMDPSLEIVIELLVERGQRRLIAILAVSAYLGAKLKMEENRWK